MRTPLGQRDFARLWSATFFSEVGEWILQVALPLQVYALTGSAASTAATMVLGLLPAVLLSPVAGVLADRFDRRLVLLCACAGQCAAALPLLALGTNGALVLLYVVMGAQAAIASVIEPARNALVPSLVGAADVTTANALIGLNATLARLAGAWLGGVVLATGGLSSVVAAYLVTTGCAVALLVAPFPHLVPATEPGERTGALRSWLEGLGEFIRDTRLRVTGVVIVLISCAQGMFLLLFVLFVTGPLGGGEAEVGLLRGVQAIGGLAAGAVLAVLGRRLVPGALFGWGVLAFAIISFVIWNGPALTVALGVYVGLFIVVGAPGVVLNTGMLSLLQTGSAPALTGRVLSTAFAVGAAGNVAGMLTAGWLAGTVGLGGLLNVQAGLLLVAGLIALAGHRAAKRTPVTSRA
ncbi:MFS transporter [Prauserella marina]|uniref:Predicted arabinose efflux permease, MFS family n=1 Tax=Prauserella marina TaxID=530584 RepID=A0A222VR78_9PSEU|nr:MFS transporter [Prauserella marina]ASR36427.1 MFS transporter [Prauserella marina]PWV77237.1 putative MFS family arabinose efflux permease [Prauserella marina]SDD07542.1 Predicted arabinose efflux permease, MFS family [Prauserella marina]